MAAHKESSFVARRSSGRATLAWLQRAAATLMLASAVALSGSDQRPMQRRAFDEHPIARSHDITSNLKPQCAAPATTTGIHVAVCFFGMTRNLARVLNSTEANLLVPLRALGSVDIFVHAHVQLTVSNTRLCSRRAAADNATHTAYMPACERAQPLESFDAVLLRACILELEDAELIDQTMNVRMLAGRMSRTVCKHYDSKTCRNYVRSRYSLWRVALQVLKHERESAVKYSHVFACRPDLMFVQPVVWKPLKGSGIVVPNVQMFSGVNDRVAYGDRTSMLNSYMRSPWELMNKGDHLATKFPTNGETFLCEILASGGIRVSAQPIYAHRVRANGGVALMDQSCSRECLLGPLANQSQPKVLKPKSCRHQHRSSVREILVPLPLSAEASLEVAAPEASLQLRVIVLTMNRTSSLQRLLSSVAAGINVSINVQYQIRIDALPNATTHQPTLRVADDFVRSHGGDVIRRQMPGGLKRAWLEAWTDPRPGERALILEDDVELSPFWYLGLKRLWAAYGERADVAGVSLQNQETVMVQKSTDTYAKVRFSARGAFMYRLVGSIGFSPEPRQWLGFLEWLQSVNTNSLRVGRFVSNSWYARKSTIWTHLFIAYCHENDLYTVYAVLEGAALAAHHRETGEHFQGAAAARMDTKLLQHAAIPTPQNPPMYDWAAKQEAALNEARVASAFGATSLGAIPVIVSTVSTELVRMANNLLCSLDSFARQDLVAVLLFSTEPTVCTGLSVSPELTAGDRLRCVYPYAADDTIHSNFGLEQKVQYQSRRYARLMDDKLRLLRLVLRAPWAASSQLIFTDVDVVFIRHPLMLTTRTLSLTHQRPAVLVSTNECMGSEDAYHGRMCAGLLVVLSARKGRALADHAWALLQSGVTYDNMDQGAWRAALSSRDSYARGEAAPISCGAAMPGYKLAEWAEAATRKQLVAYHMNWIASSEVKLHCMRAAGLWLYNDTSPKATCHAVQEPLQGFRVVHSPSRRRQEAAQIVACHP